MGVGVLIDLFKPSRGVVTGNLAVCFGDIEFFSDGMESLLVRLELASANEEPVMGRAKCYSPSFDLSHDYHFGIRLSSVVRTRCNLPYRGSNGLFQSNV